MTVVVLGAVWAAAAWPLISGRPGPVSQLAAAASKAAAQAKAEISGADPSGLGGR